MHLLCLSPAHSRERTVPWLAPGRQPLILGASFLKRVSLYTLELGTHKIIYANNENYGMSVFVFMDSGPCYMSLISGGWGARLEMEYLGQPCKHGVPIWLIANKNTGQQDFNEHLSLTIHHTCCHTLFLGGLSAICRTLNRRG